MILHSILGALSEADTRLLQREKFFSTQRLKTKRSIVKELTQHDQTNEKLFPIMTEGQATVDEIMAFQTQGIHYDAMSMRGLSMLLNTVDFKRPEVLASEWTLLMESTQTVFNINKPQVSISLPQLGIV